MGERANRRFATVVGLILGLTAFVGDLALTPPPFIADEVQSVIDTVNKTTPTTTTVPEPVPTAPVVPEKASEPG